MQDLKCVKCGNVASEDYDIRIIIHGDKPMYHHCNKCDHEWVPKPKDDIIQELTDQNTKLTKDLESLQADMVSEEMVEKVAEAVYLAAPDADDNPLAYKEMLEIIKHSPRVSYLIEDARMKAKAAIATILGKSTPPIGDRHDRTTATGR